MVTTAPTLDVEGRHPATEAWLDGLGVAWHFDPEFSLNAIDLAASRANQARLESLDEDTVERYAADYERGDVFPPLLVRHPRGRSATVLIGGNHRATAASRAKRRTHAAYVVDVATDIEALRLAYEDNRRHGLAPSDEERVFQALHLIEVDPSLTLGRAAAVVGLSVSKMNQGVARVRADRRAKELGIAGWSSLAKSTRTRLSTVSSDAVFEQAARVVVVHELATEAVFSLVRQINVAGDDEEGLAIVREMEESLASRPRSHRHREGATPRARMMEALRIVAGLDPIATVRSCTDAEQRNGLHDQIMRAARVMGTVAEKLTT